MRFADPRTIETESGLRLQADRLIICTGGVSRRLPIPGFELTSTHSDAWRLTAVPPSMLVVGSGATGVQVASIFHAFENTRKPAFSGGIFFTKRKPIRCLSRFNSQNALCTCFANHCNFYVAIWLWPALQKLADKHNLRMHEFGLVELNEAFAAQVLACDRVLNFNRDRLNVNGGAIALGHPIGCTGTRITVTLLHEMLKRNTKKGVATLCVSGGMGMALALENAV